MNKFSHPSSWKLVIPLAVLAIASLACGITLGNPNFNPNPSINQPAPAQVTVAPFQATGPTQVVTPVPTVAAQPLPQTIQNEQDLLVNLYKRINPSVVNITIYASSSGPTVPGQGSGGSQGGIQPLAEGSGWVYDSNHNIVTNAHVVQGAQQIEVTFSDGTIVAAKLVGQDLNSDLAVVHVDQMPAGVGPIPLADIKSVQVGDTVVAIGNPFGLNGTLTRGIVSALGREIPGLNTFQGSPFSIPQAIQTDAAINPGNSGGPLLNLDGQLIGINDQIETNGTSNANTGVGFAIPVNIIQRSVPDLISKGTTEWSWMGISGGNLTPTLAQGMKLKVDRGAYIDTVTPGSPAETAGLQGSTSTATVNGRIVPTGGDVVTAIDGHQIQSFDDLLVYIALETRPGQTIKLTILRNGQSQEISLKLAARPSSLNNTQSP